MLLRRRLRLGGGLLALGVVALFAGHSPPVRGDRSGSSHNLESHQYKDSRKCLITSAALGCGGKRTAMAKRHAADKRQRGGGGGGSGGGGGGVSGGGGSGGNDRDNDLDHNINFDYNYDDGGGGGGGADGGFSVDGGQDGGADTMEAEYYEPPLITDPRDRMLPVIYNPRPMYAPPPPMVVPAHQQQYQHQQQQQQPPLPPPPPSQYNRYTEDVPRISSFEVPIIECPPTEDGFERFACPTPDKEGRFRCIDDHVLCDGYIDCPNGDDEDRKNCFFFKTTKAHLDILADALLRWARGR